MEPNTPTEPALRTVKFSEVNDMNLNQLMIGLLDYAQERNEEVTTIRAVGTTTTPDRLDALRAIMTDLLIDFTTVIISYEDLNRVEVYSERFDGLHAHHFDITDDHPHHTL